MLPSGQVVLGKYRIDQALGRGPVSTTYASTMVPEGEVALRVLEPSCSRPDVHQRLLGLQTVLARIADPSLLRPIEIGQLPDGTIAIATWRSPNPSLALFVDARPLGVDEAIAFLKSLGRLLDQAYAIGVAHLCLKPTNVFVGFAPDPAAQVCDFEANMLRMAAPDPSPPESLAWLAPEQVGSLGAGPQTDVFSAALLFFFSMTRHSFWACTDGQRPDRAQWERELLSARPPLSYRAGALGVSLPPALDMVFARAVSYHPGERFATVSEFAQALSHAYQGAPAPEPAFRAASLPAPSADGGASIHPAGVPGKGRGMLWVVFGLLGFLAIGGGVATAVVLARGTQNSRGVPSASGAPPPSGPASASGPRVAPAPATDVGAREAADAGYEDASFTVKEEGGAREEAGTREAEGVLTVSCDPKCDSVEVDGKTVDGYPDPIVVVAGSHEVKAIKSGYVTQSKKVDLKADEPKTVKFALLPAPKGGGGQAPAQPAPTPKKNCGKFLKRCD